jgi:hypothetical protein
MRLRTEPVELRGLLTKIKQAVCVSVRGIQLPGIYGAEVNEKLAISSEQLRRVAAELEQNGHSEIRLEALVELFLHFCNGVLSSMERTEFLVKVNADENNLRATASNEKNWAMAWAIGMEPIRQESLKSMRRDIRKIDDTLKEDSYAFKVAMVLLVSEEVGPYVDRIATFVGYPRSLVQVIASRLQKAEIWHDDEVRCKPWFDPKTGGMAFRLALMTGRGWLTRAWSEHDRDYRYFVDPSMRHAMDQCEGYGSEWPHAMEQFLG